MGDGERRLLQLPEPRLASVHRTDCRRGEGVRLVDANHPDNKGEAERTFASGNARREAFRIEYRLRRADGVYRWAIDAAAPRFGPGSEFLGYIGSVIDIDERKEAEERQKLLVQELHHRVKNNLATVQSMVNFTLRTSETMDDFRKSVAHACPHLRAVTRC